MEHPVVFELFGAKILAEKEAAFPQILHQHHRRCLRLSNRPFPPHIETASFNNLIEMSQSNTLSSSQSISNHDSPQLASRNNRSDRNSPTAELPDQHNDTAPGDADTSQSTSTEQLAASTTSTPSPGSDYNKPHDAYGASTYAGIKTRVSPCEPCECRELRCDGVRPMCNNCATDGRRCSYAN